MISRIIDLLIMNKEQMSNLITEDIMRAIKYYTKIREMIKNINISTQYEEE